MNKFMQEHGELFAMTQQLRGQLMDTLNDDDLRCSPGGSAMTLGALCREMGDVQHSYIQSTKNLMQDWSYRHPDPAMETSVAKLKTWYAELDQEFKQIMENATDADLEKVIDRGFPMPTGGQFHAYREALLIFYGKASIYLRAMDRALPGEFPGWIG